MHKHRSWACLNDFVRYLEQGGIHHTMVGPISRLHGVQVFGCKCYSQGVYLLNMDVRAIGLKSFRAFASAILGTRTMVDVFQT